MFCPRCTHSLGEIDKFCSQCGASVTGGLPAKGGVSWGAVAIGIGIFLLGVLVLNFLTTVFGSSLSSHAQSAIKGGSVLVLLLASAGCAASRSSAVEGALVVIGTIVGSIFLFVLAAIAAFNLLGANDILGLAASKLPGQATAPAAPEASPQNPARQYQQERELEVRSLENIVDYEKVGVSDLTADPKSYNAKKVAFTGFYSGQDLDTFYVQGRFAAGGMVQVDGTSLSPQVKKQVLATLGAFHKVLITGVFHTANVPTESAWKRLDRVVTADQVIDLGRADTNSN